MKILFIAPLPPPVHGQSLASEIFLKEIIDNNEVKIVNMAKSGVRDMISRINRIFEVAQILIKILISSRQVDIIYLTISESVLGNIKDLLIYLICFKSLDKMFIHLHGGGGMINITRGNNVLLARLNAFFIKRLRGVIILGETQRDIFEHIIPSDKIHIVPNFAEDYLFIDEDKIAKKFQINNKINILFLSNLIYGKGHIELLDAYISLDDTLRSRITINFAGAFDSAIAEKQFLNKIKNFKNIAYRGVVVGDEKKKLLEASQIFCLPTYYPYEGQPISILEAYAAGCVVLTTDHGGIRDIFKDKVNGYEVEKRSSRSIKSTIEHITRYPGELLSIGLYNRKTTQEKYRTSIYASSLKRIMEI